MTLQLVGTAATVADPIKVDQNFASVESELANLQTQIDNIDPSTPPASVGEGNYTNVKDFGATGDGVTDDTQAIADALSSARLRDGAVFFPAGTYRTGTITLLHKDKLIGESRYTTIIKQKDGANSTVIQGKDAYPLFAAPIYDVTAGANQVVIQSLTVDGNRANSTNGSGIVLWGYGMTIKDVTIRNCRHDGLRTGWTDGNASMEGTFENIVIDTVGYHGWRFDGPHDSHVSNMMVIDASQEANNGFMGIISGYARPSSARFFNIHVWHRGASTNRCAVAFQSHGSSEVIASHLEGCRTQIRHAGTDDRVIGCLIYAPFGVAGSSLVTFASGVNQHIGNKYHSGYDQYMNKEGHAIQFGEPGLPSWDNQVFDAQFMGFDKRTPFNFVNSTGANRVFGRGYAPSGGIASFYGTPHATDEIDYVQIGTNINYRKPAAYPVFSSNTAAATGGVPVDGLYILSGTNALTRRV